MNQVTETAEILDVADRTVAAAGCASMITIDDGGLPSSRPVAAFPPDAGFSRIVIGSDTGSRKTEHIRRNANVVLAYVDLENRGYVTALGKASIGGDTEERLKYWTERFFTFFPNGPESDEYCLIAFVPQRLEVRSFGLGVAAVPTQWCPKILERDSNGDWQQKN